MDYFFNFVEDEIEFYAFLCHHNLIITNAKCNKCESDMILSSSGIFFFVAKKESAGVFG